MWKVRPVLDPVNPDSAGPLQILASREEKLQGSIPKDSSPEEVETPEEAQSEDP